MAEIVLQPSSKDAFLNQETPNINFGSTYLYTRSWHSGKATRTIVEFPVVWGTDIPAGAVITSAVLYLYYYWHGAHNPVGRAVWANRVLRTNWVETQATWNIYQTGSNWATAGCSSDGNDYTSIGEVSTTFPPAYGWMTWDVLTQVQACQVGSVNPIFRIKEGAEISIGYDSLFYSREEVIQTTLRPKLVIEYTEAAVRAVTTLNIAYQAFSWVLAKILVANELNETFYVGVQWWKEVSQKSIQWYNPPGGATTVAPSGTKSINIGGLLPATAYYWQANGKYNSTVVLGEVKSFLTESVPPVEPIFGAGEGNKYLAAKVAIEQVARLSVGRMYVNPAGSIEYESRFRRQA